MFVGGVENFRAIDTICCSAGRMMLDPSIVRDFAERVAAPYLSDTTGVVVGIATRADSSFQGFGRIDAGRAMPPDQSTLFEIGSITKVFTSILLARRSHAGAIDLDLPIGRIVPVFAAAPDWITPRSLATHTSGLPRLPVPLWKLPFLSAENPYANITTADLAAWLARYRPRRPPKPGQIHYSNLGVGLLGQTLALASGLTYEDAVRRYVLTPLGLDDTCVHLDTDQLRRLATPHRKPGRATRLWDFDALAGAGALRSTATDLVRLGRAVIGAAHGDGPLADAIAMTLAVQVASSEPPLPDQCLGWVKLHPEPAGPGIYFHDGGTRGSSSALFVMPLPGLVVAVLANRGLDLRTQMRLIRSRPDRLVAQLANNLSAAA